MATPTPCGYMTTPTTCMSVTTPTSYVSTTTPTPCMSVAMPTPCMSMALPTSCVFVATPIPAPVPAQPVFDSKALGLCPVNHSTKVKVVSAANAASQVLAENAFSTLPNSRPAAPDVAACRLHSTSTSPPSSPSRTSPFSSFPSSPTKPPICASLRSASTLAQSPSASSSSLSSSSSSSSSTTRSRTRASASASCKKTYSGDVSDAEISRMRLSSALCRTVNVRMRRHYRRRLARVGSEGVNFRHVQRANESFCVRTGDRQFYRGLALAVRHPLVLTPSPFCPDRARHLRGVGELLLELPLACPTCWSVQRNSPPFPHPQPQPLARPRPRSRPPTPPHPSPPPHPALKSSLLQPPSQNPSPQAPAHLPKRSSPLCLPAASVQSPLPLAPSQPPLTPSLPQFPVPSVLHAPLPTAPSQPFSSSLPAQSPLQSGLQER